MEPPRPRYQFSAGSRVGNTCSCAGRERLSERCPNPSTCEYVTLLGKGTTDVIKIKHREMDRLSRTRLPARELLESLHAEKLSPLWLEGAVSRPRQRPGCEGGGWGREPTGVGVPKAGQGPVVALLGGRQEEPALRPLSDPPHCV